MKPEPNVRKVPVSEGKPAYQRLTPNERAAIETLDAALAGVPPSLKIETDDDGRLIIWKGRAGQGHVMVANLKARTL